MCRHWIRSTLSLAAAALLTSPSVAAAEGGIRFGVSVFGGYGRYQMTDVNKHTQAVFNVVNTNLAASSEPGRVTLGELNGGADFGGGIRAWVARDILVSAEYERLLTKVSNDGTAGGANYHAEVKAPADAFTLTGAYLLPSSAKARFGLGAGVGYFHTKMTSDLTAGGLPVTDYDLGTNPANEPILTPEAKGHGFGFHGLLLMDLAVTLQIHGDVRAGYRYAKTSELKDSRTDQVVYVVDPATGLDTTKKLNADWSGVFARAGVTYFFGKAD